MLQNALNNSWLGPLIFYCPDLDEFQSIMNICTHVKHSLMFIITKDTIFFLIFLLTFYWSSKCMFTQECSWILAYLLCKSKRKIYTLQFFQKTCKYNLAETNPCIFFWKIIWSFGQNENESTIIKNFHA